MKGSRRFEDEQEIDVAEAAVDEHTGSESGGGDITSSAEKLGGID